MTKPDRIDAETETRSPNETVDAFASAPTENNGPSLFENFFDADPLPLCPLVPSQAPDARACRQWDYPEQGRWNADEGCCAREGAMACADGHRLRPSRDSCSGCAYNYECVPCGADDASCRGNLDEDGKDRKVGDCPADLYVEYSCAGSPRAEVVQDVARKAGAGLSILGSSYILALVGGKWRSERGDVDPYQRIMAAYSAYDILSSFFAAFLGSWMTPAETGWYGAAGNVATCSMQGFFFTFGQTGSVLYQAMYSLQMLLLVTYKWRSSQFERRIEYRMHGSIFVFTVTFASVPFFFQGYNPYCGYCAFLVPLGCSNDGISEKNGTTECLRGNAVMSNAYTIIFFVLLVGTVVFCTGAMVAIYRSVRRQERSNSNYRHGGGENRTMSRQIRKSMILYTGSFYLCWILGPLITLPFFPPALHPLGYTLGSLMGLLNMLVFILPKCIKYQKEHTGTWLPVAYFFVLFKRPIAAIGNWSSAATASHTATAANTVTAADTAADTAEDGIALSGYNEPGGAERQPLWSEAPVEDPAAIAAG